MNHKQIGIYYPYALFAYNVSVHRILQETPFYLSFGRDARIPIDYIITDTIDDGGNIGAREYAMSLVSKLKDVHTRVTDILININEERNENIGDDVISDIVVGDKVWLYKPTAGVGKSKKLTRHWTGPYIVVSIIGRTTYVIQVRDKTQKVHVNMLKKAYADDTTSVQSYNDQLQLAQAELESINQANHDMMVKQIDVKQRIAQLQALMHVREENNVSMPTSSVATNDNTVESNSITVTNDSYAVTLYEFINI